MKIFITVILNHINTAKFRLYQKYSHLGSWGKGSNINPQPPIPTPIPDHYFKEKEKILDQV